MEINYLGSFSYLDSIDIPNIGEFNLECINDFGFYYYVVVKTLQGKASIFSWGPVIPDINLIPESPDPRKTEVFNFTLTRIKWNEKKIKNNIFAFINGKDKKISSVKLISEKEALKQIKDMKNYISNFGEDSY